MTKKPARAAVAALALLAPVPLTLTTITPAEAAPGRYFSSCDNLHRAWPNGVAKSTRAAAKTARDGYSRPATSEKARKVYQRNYTRLDRDRDGTACETN